MGIKIRPGMYQTRRLARELDEAGRKTARRKRFIENKERLYVWYVLEKLKQELLEELRHDRKSYRIF